MSRRTTIFRQLIFNVVIPAVIALVILAILNFQNTRHLLVDFFTEKNYIISDEINKVIEFQEQAFDLLDETLSARMKELSNELVTKQFRDTRNIKTADLLSIQKKLDMVKGMEDIYVINSEGIVVNTTFENDRGLNLFGFGVDHKNYLLRVLHGGEFVEETFTIEAKTNRPKKYTYQPTLDGKYIIELGMYSERADGIINFIESAKKDIVNKQHSIVDVELFFMADNPFSLNKSALLLPEQDSILKKRFVERDTFDITQTKNRRRLNYAYMYVERENTELYKGSVIRIISDWTAERKLLQTELLKFLILFGLTTLAVIILTYRKTRVITDPIKKLMENVNRITNGHLDERAEVIGNNEITNLSKNFNIMIAQLEELYNDLEQKVKDRTNEIQKQKEEIEAQRDSIEEQRNILAERNELLNEAYHEIEQQQRNITDSIYYARRIQKAILPPDDFIHCVFQNIFVYYRPKDIVSGDFYWFEQKEGISMVAAVDCTGHGVPGAFMSIVGFNQLNYVVGVLNARKPSEILNALNEGVTRTLREKTTLEGIKDGMDIALCTFDAKQMKLQFAGAYNPMIMIRNGELSIYKGDKFPIGAFVEGTVQDFANHEIEVREGDCIYVFSDGFADQFGGPENKKFLFDRFRKMLVAMHTLPIEEQYRKVNETFEQWKGDEEQVDDVLVIGIRI